MQQYAVNAAKAAFFDLWQQCSLVITVLAVWDGFSSFFLMFCETRNAIKTQHLAAITNGIHVR